MSGRTDNEPGGNGVEGQAMRNLGVYKDTSTIIEECDNQCNSIGGEDHVKSVSPPIANTFQDTSRNPTWPKRSIRQ
jgi:hypothetical protein